MDEDRPEAKAKLHPAPGASDGSRSTTIDDPQRLARQAIRTQTAAREYAERQLVRAEQVIADFGAKLHAIRREKTLALEAVRVARDAQAQAERACRAAEAASRIEKSASQRAQQEVGEARTLVQGLRTRLAHADQAAEMLQVQLEQERQARIAAEQSIAAGLTPAADTITDVTQDQAAVKPKRGRPLGSKAGLYRAKPVRKTAASADPAPVQWWIDGWTPRS